MSSDSVILVVVLAVGLLCLVIHLHGGRIEVRLDGLIARLEIQERVAAEADARAAREAEARANEARRISSLEKWRDRYVVENHGDPATGTPPSWGQASLPVLARWWPKLAILGAAAAYGLAIHEVRLALWAAAPAWLKGSLRL